MGGANGNGRGVRRESMSLTDTDPRLTVAFNTQQDSHMRVIAAYTALKRTSDARTVTMRSWR